MDFQNQNEKLDGFLSDSRRPDDTDKKIEAAKKRQAEERQAFEKKKTSGGRELELPDDDALESFERDRADGGKGLDGDGTTERRPREEARGPSDEELARKRRLEEERKKRIAEKNREEKPPVRKDLLGQKRQEARSAEAAPAPRESGSDPAEFRRMTEALREACEKQFASYCERSLARLAGMTMSRYVVVALCLFLLFGGSAFFTGQILRERSLEAEWDKAYVDCMKSSLTGFLVAYRTVTPDGYVLNRNMDLVYSFLSTDEPFHEQVNREYKDEATSPASLARSKVVVVDHVDSVVMFSRNKWQINWSEKVFDRRNNQIGKTRLKSASVVVDFFPGSQARPEQDIYYNPLGIVMQKFEVQDRG